MNDTTRDEPREQIADIVHENYMLGDADQAAGLLIDHLWQAADDPAVVEAMYAASVNGVFGEDADSSLTGREIVQRAFEAGLTALLGPRPEGGDAHDAETNQTP